MQLVDEYDKVFLATGAQRSSPLDIPEQDLQGVLGAVEFLRAARSNRLSCSGERVAVIGGGDSAIDAARTALRLGADAVSILYRRLRQDMPAQKDEIEAALEEGIKMEFLVAPASLSGRNGKVEKLVCNRLELGPYDASGRRKPVSTGDQDFELDVDRVLVAAGQIAELPFRGQRHGIGITGSGWIEIAEGMGSETTNPKIFAGGDVASGPSTVTEAIAAGFRAAEEIDSAIRARNHEPPWIARSEAIRDIPMEIQEESAEAPAMRMKQIPADFRKRSFAEVEQGYEAWQATAESNRCLRCDIGMGTGSETGFRVHQETVR
jgi:NADH-quinone oxidoreductase subunit F